MLCLPHGLGQVRCEKIAVTCQKTINTFTRKVYFIYGISCSSENRQIAFGESICTAAWGLGEISVLFLFCLRLFVLAILNISHYFFFFFFPGNCDHFCNVEKHHSTTLLKENT